MKKILFIGAVLASCFAFATEWNPVAVAERLLEDGGSSISGHTKETGVWVVAIGCHADQKRAAMEARREIAGFLETSIESVTVSSTTETDDEVTSFFSQQTKASIDQLLKGVRIEKNIKRDEEYFAIAVLTQKSADASNVLAEAMTGDRPGTVTATGNGATKEAAIQAATRSALEQVCGTSVAASDSASDDRFRARTYADVQGVVKSYRILEEEEGDDGQWTVKIVAEVSKDELQENYGAQMKAIGDPLFYLVSDNDDALRQLGDWFIGKGLKTTTHKGTADYQISISTEFSERIHPANGRSGIQLQMTTVCFDKGGVQLFSIQNDPRKAAVFIGSKNRQCQIAVEKAIKQLSKPLHKRLQEGMNNIVNNGRSIRLIFRNCAAASQLSVIDEIVGVINNMPEAGSATSQYDEASSTATIRCNLKGNTNDFTDALDYEVSDLPTVVATETNKVIFTF